MSLAEAIFRKKPLEVTRRNAASKSLGGAGILNRSMARPELNSRTINALPGRAVAKAAESNTVRPNEANASRPLSARVVYSKGTNTLKTSGISPRLSSSFSTDGTLSLNDAIKTSSKPKLKIEKKTSGISPRLSSSFSTDGTLSLKDAIKTSSKPKLKIEKSSSNNSILVASDYENKISTLKHIILLRYILANRNKEESNQTRTDLLAAWQLVYDAEEEASALSTREILANELISIHRKLCSL